MRMTGTTRTTTRAAAAALVFCGLLAPVGPASAWSEFGESSPPAPEPAGPEIQEPFFEFLLAMAEEDSLGQWSGGEVRALAAASGRQSRFPLDEVVSLRRTRPDVADAGKYPGARIRAVWTVELTGRQDRPMPYSILGYHPGSLRIGERLVFSELGPTDLHLAYLEEDRRITRWMSEVRIFPLEEGYVALDADGFLDALLGAGLDDAWTLGFVTCREEGRRIGLGVSIGRKGRRIFGEFDFTRDKVMVNGRPPMAALSRASRRWLNTEGGNLPEPWRER